MLDEIRKWKCDFITARELKGYASFFAAKLYISTPYGCLRIEDEIELHGVAKISHDERAIVSRLAHSSVCCRASKGLRILKAYFSRGLLHLK
jgi:hypothetical protein